MGNMTVADVQRSLIRLGFDPGNADGIFGPLTEIALKRFQRAYRVRVDGSISPETIRLLRANLPSCRLLVPASGYHSLSGLAHDAGSTTHALLEANPHKLREPLYPGEILQVHRRLAACILDPCCDVSAIESQGWSLMAVPAWVATPDGDIHGTGQSTIDSPAGRSGAATPASLWGIIDLADEPLKAIARSKKRIHDTSGRLLEEARALGFAGLILRSRGLDFDSGMCFSRLLKVLSRDRNSNDDSSDLALGLGVCVELTDAHGCHDLDELCAWADWLILRTAQAPVDWKSLIDAARKAPRWKLLAGIDLQPYCIDGSNISRIGWAEFERLRTRHVMRETADTENGLQHFTFRARGRVRRITVEDRGSLSRTLRQVNTLNMLGVAVMGLPPKPEWVHEEMCAKFIPM